MEDLLEKRQKLISEFEKVITGLRIYINFRNPGIPLHHEIMDIEQIKSAIVWALKKSVDERIKIIRNKRRGARAVESGKKYYKGDTK